jgi:hypothetical protein
MSFRVWVQAWDWIALLFLAISPATVRGLKKDKGLVRSLARDLSALVVFRYRVPELRQRAFKSAARETT